MRIYPTPGLCVRDPVKRDFLPEDGRDVPDGDLYWIRRLNCGDATLEAPQASTVPAPKVDKALTNDGSDAQ